MSIHDDEKRGGKFIEFYTSTMSKMLTNKWPKRNNTYYSYYKAYKLEVMQHTIEVSAKMQLRELMHVCLHIILNKLDNLEDT